MLDASALMALLNEEPGRDTVVEIISTSSISAVNMSEVVAKMADEGSPSGQIRAVLGELSFEIIPFDAEQGYEAGLLRSSTRRRGLSLGDRCCLGLARRLGLPTITADRAWADLGLDVDIRLIR